MDNYKTIESKLSTLTPFTGNSLTARYDSAGNYLVFSYATLIAGVSNSGLRELNRSKYSVTTSRHQNLIKRAWGIA